MFGAFKITEITQNLYLSRLGKSQEDKRKRNIVLLPRSTRVVSPNFASISQTAHQSKY